MSWCVHLSAEVVDLSIHANPQKLARDIGLKHARRSMKTTACALVAAQKALGDFKIEPERLGIISSGGMLNSGHCLRFLERPLQGSPKHVNPLDFPHTLISALPTNLAEVIDAKAFAFSIGEDELSIAEILEASFDLLSIGAADCVIAVFASCDDGTAARLFEAGYIPLQPVENAVACRIQNSIHKNSICVKPADQSMKTDWLFEVSKNDVWKIKTNAPIEPAWYGPSVGGVLLEKGIKCLDQRTKVLEIKNARGSCRIHLSKSVSDT